MARIFSLCPMMLSWPVKPAQSRRKYPASFFRRNVSSTLPDGTSQLVDQIVVLDHISIGSGFDSGDGRLERGNPRDQQKIA